MEDTVLTAESKTAELVDQLEAYCSSHEVSFAVAAKMIDVNQGILSQWRKGKYPGDNAKVEKKVEAFLERVREVAERPAEAGGKRFAKVANTIVARRMMMAIRQCHLNAEIGVVTAPSGSGKTRVLLEYAEQNPGTVVVKCRKKMRTKKVISQICRQAGVAGAKTVDDMMEALYDKLRGSGKVILLNEAEHLQADDLDLIRTLWDECEVGIVYIGIERLSNMLSSLRGDYVYIWNRTFVKVEIKREKPDALDDLHLILETNGFNGHLAEALYSFCRADLRLSEKLFFNALADAALDGVPLTDELIAVAAGEMGLKKGGVA